jgi:hypothetical protein
MNWTIHALRLFLLLTLAAFFFMEISLSWQLETLLFWMTLIVWIVLCFFGILVVFIPLTILIGIGAGAAQADWMSDAFVFWVFFAVPTFAAMGMSELFRWRASRNSHAHPSE